MRQTFQLGLWLVLAASSCFASPLASESARDNFTPNGNNARLGGDKSFGKRSGQSTFEGAQEPAPRMQPNRMTKRGIFRTDADKYFKQKWGLFSENGVKYDDDCANQFAKTVEDWLKRFSDERYPYDSDAHATDECFKTNPETGKKESEYMLILVWVSSPNMGKPWWKKKINISKKKSKPSESEVALENPVEESVDPQERYPLLDYITTGIQGYAVESEKKNQMWASVFRHNTKPWYFQYRVISKKEESTANQDYGKVLQRWNNFGVTKAEVDRMAELSNEDLQRAHDRHLMEQRLEEEAKEAQDYFNKEEAKEASQFLGDVADPKTGETNEQRITDWLASFRSVVPVPDSGPPVQDKGNDQGVKDLLKQAKSTTVQEGLFFDVKEIQQSLNLKERGKPSNDPDPAEQEKRHTEAKQQVEELRKKYADKAKGPDPSPQQQGEGGGGGSVQISVALSKQMTKQLTQKSTYFDPKPVLTDQQEGTSKEPQIDESYFTSLKEEFEKEQEKEKSEAGGRPPLDST